MDCFYRRFVFILSGLWISIAQAQPGLQNWNMRDEFPISAWVTPGSVFFPKMITETAFSNYKNAGFNLIWIPADSANILMAEKVKLHYLLSMGDFLNSSVIDSNRLNYYIQLFKDSPLKAGYFLCDEPTEDLFPRLAQLLALIRQKDPTRIGFINLLSPRPGYHIRFLNSVHPQFLMFDHYPFQQSGEDFSVLYSLQFTSTQAKKYQIPWWAFAQTTSFQHYRIPSESELRFNANWPIAYGMKGLWYFIYSQLPDFGPALADADGNPVDEKYHIVSDINHKIHAWAKYLLACESQKVYTTPDVTSYPAVTLFAPDSLLLGFEAAQYSVGILKDSNNNRFLFVVNLRHSEHGKSDQLAASARLGLVPAVKGLYEINDSTGVEEWRALDPKNEIAVTLPGGDAALYRISYESPTSVPDHKRLNFLPQPENFELVGAYPNPFNATTRIAYSIHQQSHVFLAIFDQIGRLLQVLVDSVQNIGDFHISWSGMKRPSGVYFVLMRSGVETNTKKVLLLK